MSQTNCLLQNGYTLSCRDSIGGIRRAFIGNFDTDAVYTLDADDRITGFTGSTVSYYTFEQEMEVGEFNQAGAYSTENGTVFFTQDLSLMFHKNDADLRNQLLVLSQANMSVIVEDQRGEYWLIGYANGVRATAGAMNTGRAYGDMNGVTITLQGKEPEPAHNISATASGFPI
jgi:hypothetical protein